MPVKIHNKDYYTVAERVARFREMHPKYMIRTKLISNTNYVVVKATISDDAGYVMSTGYAEEERGSTNINETSALENAETSAVGRALAFFGLAGTEIASADEVVNAIQQQAEKKAQAAAAVTMRATMEHINTILDIREGVESQDYERVAEAWEELTDEEKTSLWVAPSKGGPFTTKERDFLKSDELTAVRKQFKEAS